MAEIRRWRMSAILDFDAKMLYNAIFSKTKQFRAMVSDMVKIEIRCRIIILRTFGRIHGIPEPRTATLQGAANWRIQCHDPRATCHMAGCCRRTNSTACHPWATYHIALCYQLVNSLSWFQSHIHKFIAGCSHLAKSMSWSCHNQGVI